MPPKRYANDAILVHKGGGNWGPPTWHLGWKRAGGVIGDVQQPAQYPTGWIGMAQIIKYRQDVGYLIPKVPFYRLCQGIMSDLALEQQFRWQRSALECLQVAAEVMITMTGRLSSSPSIII